MTTPRTTAAGSCRTVASLTTDVGNQASGDGDGQLIVWFPPFNRTKVQYCKIDVGHRDRGRNPRAQRRRCTSRRHARRPPGSGGTPDRSPRRTPPRAAAASKDGTGAPLADTVQKEIFIPAGGPIATPNAIVTLAARVLRVERHQRRHRASSTGQGRSSARPEPAAGDALGAKPYKTGTPLGHRRRPQGEPLLRRHRDRGQRRTASGPGDKHRHGPADPLRRRRAAAARDHGPPTSRSPTASGCSSPAPLSAACHPSPTARVM